jgi:hypothetical protein
MGLSFSKTAFTLLLLISPVISFAEIIYPLYQDPFYFDYELMHRNAVIRQNLSLLPPAGPLFIDKAKTILNGRHSPALRIFHPERPAESDQLMRLYAVGAERFKAEKNLHSDDLASITGGFTFRPAKYFGALGFFNLDRAKAIDPDYIGKKYRGLAGEIETAALFYKRDRITIIFGRLRAFWGPQRVNLLLSETTEPLDLLSASFESGRLSVNFLFARLDQSRPDSVDFIRFPDRSFNDNRYLAGHRVDIRLHRNFRLGLFETVIFGGEGRPPELSYLNPLQFFHSAQLNEDTDDNTILGADFTYLPGAGIAAYGQILVDDFQIDKESQGDQEPDEIGIMIGLFKAGKIASLIPDLKAEYVRITNRTYHQRDPRNRYLYRNKLTGHPLGPDADSVSIKARLWPHERFFAEIELAYRRHGEGSIYKPWDEPWEEAEGDYDEPFPTGLVEKSTFVALRAQAYLPFTRYTHEHIFISIDAGWGEIKNYRNIDGRLKTTGWIDIGLSWLGFVDINLAD